MSSKPKLKPEHLVPFVLHDLNMWTGSMVCKLVLYKAQPEYKHGVMIYEAINNGVLPILRPLSDLTKDDKFTELINEELICGTWKFIQDDLTTSIETSYDSTRIVLIIQNEIALECSLLFYNYMIENHYDMFGLIPQGLAIDINTINLEDGTRKD